MSRMIKDPNGRVFESIKDFARFYNINEITTRQRIYRGWNVSDCLKDVKTRKINSIGDLEKDVKDMKNGVDNNIAILESTNKYVKYFKELEKINGLETEDIIEIVQQKYRFLIQKIEREIHREKNIKNFKQYVHLVRNDGYDERIINENLLLMGLNEYITLIKVRC